MATHSSVLAWRIPEMGEPGGLLSMGSHRVRHFCSTLYYVIALTRRTFGDKVMSLLLNMLGMLSHFSHVQLCATPQTAAHQAPPSLGFSRQEYWSGSPLPSLMDVESWTIKKAEHRRIDAFELWCWRRFLRVPWAARRSNQSILKEFFERTDAEAETPIFWPPDVKS